MNFRVFALIVAAPFFAHPAQAQDRQVKPAPAKVSQTQVQHPAFAKDFGVSFERLMLSGTPTRTSNIDLSIAK
jgi:hypothetical protein